MTRSILAAGLLCVAAFSAEAQSTAEGNEVFGDWVLLCGGGQPCRIVQQQTERDSGAFALRLVAMKNEQGAILAAQMPMGVHLASGAVYRVPQPENEPQKQMVWQRCADEVCEAAIQLGERDLDLFAQNETLIFAYRQNPQDEPRFISVSLNGFGDGLERTGQ